MPHRPEQKDRLLAVIPAFNEEESLKHTVDNLAARCPDVDFVVVDDGSSDRTADICLQNGYPLLRLPVNLGLSGAFQAGVHYAKENGYGYVMQFDADGQHLPQYIPQMLAAAKAGADVVIGSRYLDSAGKKSHSLRKTGSFLLRGAIRLTTGKTITDPTSGMRLFGTKVLDYFEKAPNFDPEPDMIAYLLRSGYQVVELPVQMEERLAGKSYLRFWRVIQYMIRMLLSILFIQWFRKT